MDFLYHLNLLRFKAYDTAAGLTICTRKGQDHRNDNAREKENEKERSWSMT